MKNTKKLLAFIVSFAIAFSCFLCVPFDVFADTTVNTESELTAALADSSIDHIIIGSPISTSTTFNITRALTLEGATIASDAYHIDGGKLDISYNGDVLIKNIKIKRSGDTVKIHGGTSQNVTISGGEIYNTHSESGNEGALYVADFDGLVTVTDDAVIKSSNWVVYFNTNWTDTGTIHLLDCTVTNLANGSRKDVFRQSGTYKLIIGDPNGDPNHTVNVSTAGGKIWQTESKGDSQLDIYDGATFTNTTTDYGFDVNQSNVTVNIHGGTFNIPGLLMRINQGDDKVNVSGGTFNCTANPAFNMNDSNATLTITGGTFNGSGTCPYFVEKNNGTVTISGGTFNNTAGAIVKSISGKNNGKLTISGGNFTASTSVVVVDSTIVCDVTGGSFTAGDSIFDLNNTGTFTFRGVNISSSTGNVFDLGASVQATVDDGSSITVSGNAKVAVGDSTATLHVLNSTITEGKVDGPILDFKEPEIFGVNGTFYGTMAKALNNVADGGTITLNQDVTGAVEINTTKTVTIAGNSKSFGTLNINGGNVTLSGVTASAVKFGDSANVTISGGAIGGGDSTALELKSGFSGTVNVIDDAQITSNNLAVDVSSSATGATLNLKDCTVNKLTTGGELIHQAGDNTINIGDGVTGHEAIVSATSAKIWETKGNYAKLNVYNGATITNPNADWSIYVNHSNSVLHVYGGTFNFGGPAIVLNDSGASVIIDGGTFNGTHTADACDRLIQKNNGALTITGGTFTNDFGSVIYTGADKNSGTLSITGGTFSAGGPVLFLESSITTEIGAVDGDDSDVTFTSSGTVDTKGIGVITVKNGTLNVNSGTLTQDGDGSHHVIAVAGSGSNTVNVKGGTLVHTGRQGAAVYTASDATNTTVNVTGGTFDTDYPFIFNSAATYNFDGVDIYAEAGTVFTLGPNVLVTLDNGSEIDYQGFDYAAEGNSEAPATIITLNGSYIDDEICNNVIVQDDRPRYFQIGDEQYETIADALADVENGQTIELIATVGGNVTLDADKTYTLSTGDYEITGVITVSDGTVTLDGVEASGIKLGGDAAVTVNGGTYSAGTGNAIEFVNGFTGSLTVDGNAEFTATGYAFLENSGSTGTLNLYNCSLTDESGDVCKLQGNGKINLGKSDGTGSVTISNGSASGDVFYFDGGQTDIDTYAGLTISGGKPFNIAQSARNVVVNIYGGTFNANTSCYIIDLRCPAVVNISGGTFKTNNNYIKVNNSACNGATLNITGGTFDPSGLGNSAVFSISNEVSNLNLTVSNLTFTREDGGEIVYSYAKSGTFNFVNDTFTQNDSVPVVCILGIKEGSANTVNISNCNFYSYQNSAVKFATDNDKTLEVNILSDSTFTSNFANAISKTEGVTINGNGMLTENSANIDGTAKIFRMSGKVQEYYPGIERTISGLAANTDYTFTFNYRATGGANLWKTVEYNGSGLTPVSDTGTTLTYTFTTDDSESHKLWIRLGRNEAASIGGNGSLYLADFSLKASGSSDELIANGDFSGGLEGWKLINHVKSSLNATGFISYVQNFFNDSALETASLNYALALKGGDRHEVQFKAYLEANTSYTFSYYYRAYGDTPTFGVEGSGITVSSATSANNMFKKTYTVTNNNDEGKKVRFWFRGGAGSIDNIVYISGVSLYKAGTGANLIADLDPVFGTTDALRISQYDSTAMTNVVGHGWLGNFQSDSDGGSVNVGSNKYTSVIEVPANFYVRLSDADILTALVSVIIGATNDTINPYYDVTRDGVINIIDLVRFKKQTADNFGAEPQATALKSTIMNAANTQTKGTVYYVSNSGNDSKAGTATGTALATINAANNKAKSGDTILLERGGTWRVSASNSSSITFKSGVTYGAYGTGAKPEILGSTKNWANATWTNEGNNVWSVTFNSSNGYSTISSSHAPGNVYFVEKGSSDVICGVGIKDGTYLTETTQLTKAGEFAAKHGTGFKSGSGKKVYIYCESNPSTVYDRIEIAESRDVVTLNSNVTVDNIAVKFGGAHGLNGSNLTNVKITNCEIGYIGGKLNGTEDEDGTAPMGNGIQFGQGGSNLEASYNYIYQCYDAGVTYQKWSNDQTFTDVRFTNNLLTNNFYNIEVWSDNNGLMKDILIEGNVLKDAGYCWSWGQRFETGNINIYASNIYGGKNSYNTNSGNSLIIRNNVFDNTRANQVCWYWDNSLPATYEYLTVSGNSFYQKKGSYDDYSMHYGNVGATVTYASSQDSLEYAVSKFDKAPQIVCWVETD